MKLTSSLTVAGAILLLLAAFTLNRSHEISRDVAMVWVPAGVFEMGCTDCEMPDALPVHKVELSGFWMDQTPVTNSQFERFVVETHYLTTAERPISAENFPNLPPDQLQPGSAVFSPPSTPVTHDDAYAWWKYVPGANWRHPEGTQSDLSHRQKHPVVHVSYDDARAYCQWIGKRLPTEAEFEYAARGGLQQKRYSWGDELKPQGHWAANIWQGSFPDRNSAEDGYAGTSPVKAFPANGYGLYDMSGNVWQWCSDWYRPDTYANRADPSPAKNPQGPSSSFDPADPETPKRVQRGGSFLCSDQYCSRYLVGSRGKGAVDSGSSNLGFRCVKPEI